jgi:hypothetical protein
VASSLPGANNSRFKIRSNYKHGSRSRVSSKHKCTPNLEYRSIRIELRDEQVTGYTDFRSDNISANRKKGNQALGAV